MAPEQADPRRGGVGPRTDIYGLGGILYALLAGRPPFEGESFAEVISKLLDDDPPVAPRKLVPQVPEPLEAICLRCLRKDTGERYPTARDVARAVRAWLGEPVGPESVVAPAGLRQTLPVLPRSALPRISLRVHPENVRAGEDLVLRAEIECDAPSLRLRILPQPGSRLVHLGPGLTWQGPGGGAVVLSFHFVALEPGSFSIEATAEADEGRSTETLRINVQPWVSLPFVGRAETHESLGRWFGAEECGLFLIRGEPGVGKTRLAREAALRWAEQGGTKHGKAEQGAVVVSGRCRRSFRFPLQPFREISLALLHLVEPEVNRQGFLELLDASLRHLLPDEGYVADYFAAFFSGRPISPEQKPMVSYYWLQLLARVAAGRPILAVLDDVEWAETDTIQLLAELLGLAQQRNINFKVLTLVQPFGHGPEEKEKLSFLETKVRELKSDRIRVEVVDLTPLEESEIVNLVDVSFPGNSFRRDFPWLYAGLRQKTGGNPLFAEWVLKRIRSEVGAEKAAGVPWELPPSLNQEWFESVVPQEIGSVLDQRLIGLGAEASQAVQVAATIGDPFDLRLLERLLGGTGALDRCLPVLEREELVAPTEDPVVYRFRHSLIPQRVYRDFTEGSHWRASRLHGQIADAMASIYTPEELDDRPLVYAHHLLAANRRDEAFRYLVKGAGRLLELQLYSSAVSHLEKAHKLTKSGVRVEPRDEALLHYRLGETYRVLGRTDEALQHLGLARDLEAPLDEGLRASIDLTRGSIHVQRGELDTAQEVYRNVLSMPLPEHELQISMAISGAAAVQRVRGELTEALSQHLRALDLRKKAGAETQVAISWVNVGNAHFDLGDHEEAEKAFRKSIPIFRAKGLKNYLIYALSGLGNVFFRKDRRQALECYEEAIRLCKETGNRAQLGVLHYNLGEIAFTEHRYTAALRELALSLDIMEAAGRRPGEAEARSRKAELHRLLCEYEAAGHELERARAAALVTGNPMDLAAVRIESARLALAREDRAGARDEIEEALRLISKRGDAPAVLACAVVLIDLGELARARALVEQAAKDPSIDSRPEARCLLEHLRGLCSEALAGRLQHLEAALALAGEAYLDLPALLFDLAAAAGEPRAAQLLEKAAEILKRRAESIDDPAAKERYLSQNPSHRRILLRGA